MGDCKWAKDEICVNSGCEMGGDFCPFYDKYDACRHSSENNDKRLDFINDMEKVWHDEAANNPEYAAGVQFVLIEFIKRFRSGA